MFDAYLDNRMSGDEKAEFEALLGSDKKLKQEFKDYKEIMFALQSSCSDADKEFEEALKGISDEDMKNIVSSKKEQGTQTQLFAEEKPKGKMVPLKTVYRWVSAAAAVLLLVGVGTHLFLGRQPKNGINTDLVCDNVVKGYNFSTINSSRSSSNGDENEYNKAINLINDNKTVQAIPILEELYKNPTNKQMRPKYSISLANAYLKNHDLKNAQRIILNELKNAQKDENNIANLDQLLELEEKIITELSNELNKK